MPRILSSKIGHVNGSEIVRVEYDSKQTRLPVLVQALRNQSSFYSLIAKNEAERDHAKKMLNSIEITIIPTEPNFVESKYTLKSLHPELYYLDLTEQQAIGFNSWSYFGGPMPEVLTTSLRSCFHD